MTRPASRLLASSLALLVAACLAATGLLVWQIRFRQPPVINGDLAFETLERDRAPDAPTRFFPRTTPGLVVLTSSQDIGSASAWLNDSAVRALRALDWDEHLAVVVFLGRQTHSVGGFEIVQIARQDGEVSIYANTGPIGEEVIPTSPYHVVAVRKVGQWARTLSFRFYLDQGAQVARVERVVPGSSVPLWPK